MKLAKFIFMINAFALAMLYVVLRYKFGFSTTLLIMLPLSILCCTGVAGYLRTIDFNKKDNLHEEDDELS